MVPALMPLTAAAPTMGVAAESAEGGGVETAVANVVVAVAVQQAARAWGGPPRMDQREGCSKAKTVAHWSAI